MARKIKPDELNHKLINQILKGRPRKNVKLLEMLLFYPTISVLQFM